VGSQLVHVSRIEPHPENARSELSGIPELAASIRAVGLLQPLVVCAHPWRPAGYMLLDGHRRLAAVKLVRLDRVPVMIRAVPEDAQTVMLVADLTHSPLSVVDRAEAMGKLIANGWSPARISAETGLSISRVSQILALNDLDQGTRDRVASGIIPVTTAVKAVRHTRAATRRSRGMPPRKVSVAAEHFSAEHPLAGDARIRCELGGHGGRKVGRRAGFSGACGACWEAAIRGDERTRKTAAS
jgi:ParB/RepB/Spo0J family partition protein